MRMRFQTGALAAGALLLAAGAARPLARLGLAPA